MILTKNPSAIVLTNTEIQARLARNGFVADIWEKGSRTLDNFIVAAFDAPHAPVFEADCPQNTACLHITAAL